MKKNYWLLCRSNCTLLFLSFGWMSFAQCVPNFGAASHYALFTISGAIGNTGISNVNDSIGTNTGAITGFAAPSAVTGATYTADGNTTQAATDLLQAYTQLFNAVPTNISHAAAFGSGETLFHGVYAIGGAGSVAGNLILDGGGTPDAIFIFKIGGAFTTAAGTSITLTNGAQACNVFWVADGAIAMAAGTIMRGTVVANNGAVSMGDQGFINGRLYSTTGAIALYANVVTVEGIDLGDAVGGTTSSNQVLCGGTTPADLVVTGSIGKIIKWQKSEDATFTSPIDIATTLNVLSGTTIGNLNSTTYFRAVVEKPTCIVSRAYSTTVIITVASTTWDGSIWSNGRPTLLKSAIIIGDFTSEDDFSTCKLTVNNHANVIILSGDTVTVNGSLVIDTGSTFTLNNGATMLQSEGFVNEGKITVKRDTSLLKRFDYVLWSSPVEDQLLQSFSPQTLSNRFYSYDSALNYFVPVSSISTALFRKGISQLIRMPANQPITGTVWSGLFFGKPNNGTVTIPVTNTSYVAVGNPYPSGISANAFMAANNITEALYYWRKTNNPDNSSYAVYTTAGGTANTGGDLERLKPGVIIPVGQGLIVKSTSSNIVFTNSMRVAAVDVTFLRSTQDKSSLWIDLTSTSGIFSELLIAYMPDATLAVDPAIDGRFFNDSTTALTSLIGNEEFTIQGRPLPFDAIDVVPLGFKSGAALTYTISLTSFDGIFATGQEVFLKDNSTGTLTNLKTGAYTFSTEAGTFNSRFELHYQSSLSVAEPFTDAGVLIYKQDAALVINSGGVVMGSVKVFDVLGKLLFEQKDLNTSLFSVVMSPTHQVVVVQITSDTDITITKKALY